MKKHFLFSVIIAFSIMGICSGQSYKYIYYFDAALNSTKESKAVVIGRGIKEDELIRLDYFYKSQDKIIMSAHYVDSSLAVMQGAFTQFYLNGKVEDQGNYVDDEKSGLWQKWDSLGRKTDSTIYQHDKVINETKFNYYKNGSLSHYSYKDSLDDTFKRIFYNEKGAVSSEIFFQGQLGIRKNYDSGKVTLDSLYTREEREAAFPGGQIAWIRYLQEHLDANTPVRNGAPRGTYKVIVKFIVARDGSISDVVAETNYGYGMEREVLRIIKTGPAWVPAVQYGRKVNAYRRQPITFVVEEVRR